MSRRPAGPFVLLAVVTALIVVGSVIRSTTSAEERDRSGASVSVLDEVTGVEQAIKRLESTTETTPTSSGLDLLASLHLRRARLLGDASGFARAKDIADRSIALAPTNPDAQLIRARVLYANHEFASAARIADELLARSPANLDAWVVRADASIELGNLDDANAAVELLAAAEPASPAVAARRSRLAFLRGDAAAAMRLAEQARELAPRAGSTGSDLAFYDSLLGQLAFDRGDLEASRHHYDAALSHVSDDRVAVYGLARTLVAGGEERSAIPLLDASTQRFPDPVALALLGDAQRAAGAPEAAEASYVLVEATAALARSNAQIYDRQLTLFYADHGLRPADALAMARAELDTRRDVYAYDTLAWAAYRAGQLDEAADASATALRVGTPDAAIYAHAGLIAVARGDSSEGRRLLERSQQINPNFHPVVAPMVRATLDTIRKG